MATNTEYLKTLITTAGGDASSLPDNLESTHYKALIEALANGTGGGGTSGGDENWELITNSDEVIEGANYLILTEDNNGTPFKLKKAKLFLWTSTPGSYGYLEVAIRQRDGAICSIAGNTKNRTYRVLIEKDGDENWVANYETCLHNETTLLPTEEFTVKAGKRHNINDEFLTYISAQVMTATVIKYVLYGVRG